MAALKIAQLKTDGIVQEKYPQFVIQFAEMASKQAKRSAIKGFQMMRRNVQMSANLTNSLLLESILFTLFKQHHQVYKEALLCFKQLCLHLLWLD